MYGGEKKGSVWNVIGCKIFEDFSYFKNGKRPRSSKHNISLFSRVVDLTSVVVCLLWNTPESNEWKTKKNPNIQTKHLTLCLCLGACSLNQKKYACARKNQSINLNHHHRRKENQMKSTKWKHFLLVCLHLHLHFIFSFFSLRYSIWWMKKKKDIVVVVNTDEWKMRNDMRITHSVMSVREK